ncbi:HAD family hydrolase [Pilimelia columellifera]|uniref:HAD family hydrolase n=1 Tax=Pilimelia columellifera subsp. columellifera TaxID=706583 RepID=A0ABN3NRK7_9ACTN
MVTTVAFDADQTLLDTRRAIEAATLELCAQVARQYPGSPALEVADLHADAVAAWEAMPERDVRTVRSIALARSLGRVGLGHAHGELSEYYFAARQRLTHPYADAVSALSQLGERFVLGYATNGNSRAELCGLAGRFAFELYAHERGLAPKPAPEFYAAVLAAAGVVTGPEQVVYVGDSWSHDVVPARAAGLRTVWVNRGGSTVPDPGVADAVVVSLADLPAAVRSLAA